MGLGRGASSPSSVVKKPWLIQRIGDKDTEWGAVSVDTEENKQKTIWRKQTILRLVPEWVCYRGLQSFKSSCMGRRWRHFLIEESPG